MNALHECGQIQLNPYLRGVAWICESRPVVMKGNIGKEPVTEDEVIRSPPVALGELVWEETEVEDDDYRRCQHDHHHNKEL